LFAADFVALIFSPVQHVAFEAGRSSSDWRGFRHAPKMHYVEVVLVECAHQANRWGGCRRMMMRTGARNFQRPGFFSRA